MSFVIYNTRTFHRMAAPASGQQSFPTERAAKTIRTKVIKKAGAGAEEAAEWVVADYDTWRDAEPMVTVKHLLSGKDVQIRASERGGCCDPSTERYHTM